MPVATPAGEYRGTCTAGPTAECSHCGREVFLCDLRNTWLHWATDEADCPTGTVDNR